MAIIHEFPTPLKKKFEILPRRFCQYFIALILLKRLISINETYVRVRHDYNMCVCGGMLSQKSVSYLQPPPPPPHQPSNVKQNVA
jgi:hypothetical protein